MSKPSIFLVGALDNPAALNKAADVLRRIGYPTINPADWTEGSCRINLNLHAMSYCKAVVILPGWRTCKAARLQAHCAREFDIPVFGQAKFMTCLPETEQDLYREESKEEPEEPSADPAPKPRAPRRSRSKGQLVEPSRREPLPGQMNFPLDANGEQSAVDPPDGPPQPTHSGWE